MLETLLYRGVSMGKFDELLKGSCCCCSSSIDYVISETIGNNKTRTIKVYKKIKIKRIELGMIVADYGTISINE
jgi:hypothetical protein